MTELTEISITSSARRGLEEAGISSLEALAARSREEISAVRGVGAAALAVIERELAARGLTFDTAPARVEPVETAPARVEPVETALARVEPVETAPARVEPLPGYNPLAIVALVLLLAVPPASIVVGHIALGQIARTPQKGRELALTATILGYVFTGVAVLSVLIGLALVILVVVTTAGAIMAAAGGMAGVPLPLGFPGR